MKKFFTLLLALCAIYSTQAQSTVPSGLDNTAQEDWDVLRLTNNERISAGLPIYITTNLMQYFGAQRAYELLDYYSHDRPTGESWSTILDEYNFDYTNAAENIANGYTSPAAVVEGWMNSPGHRQNILNGALRYLGTGMRDNGKKYWAQVFGTINGSEATSVRFDSQSNSFIFTLANGDTGYAPYDPQTFSHQAGKAIVNYPGVSGAVAVGKTASSNDYNNNNNYESKYSAENNSNPQPNNLTNSNKDFTLQIGIYDGYIASGDRINNKITGTKYSENDSELFAIDVIDHQKVMFRNVDGKYLSHNSKLFNNSDLVLSDEPYIWVIIMSDSENITLRCSEDLGMVVGVENGKLVVLDRGNIDVPREMQVSLYETY